MQNTLKSKLENLLNQLPPSTQDKKDAHGHEKPVKTEAERDFIQKCSTSKYTEACLELMKEGKVPYRIVSAILQNNDNTSDDILSFFKSDISLKSLIGKHNIAILKNGDRCIALDHNDDTESNEGKIKSFFKNITNKGRLIIYSHGTYGYSSASKEIRSNSKDTILYLSNIPNGFITSNDGVRERVDKYSDLILSSAEHYNTSENGNNKKIIISTNSYSNLFGAKIAKILAEKNYKVDMLQLKNIANSYVFFQSADDISEVILSIPNEKINNIDKINIWTDDSIHHPIENTNKITKKLSDELLIRTGKSNIVNNEKIFVLDNRLYDCKFKNGEPVGQGNLTYFYENGGKKKCQEGYFNNNWSPDDVHNMLEWYENGNIKTCLKRECNKDGKFEGQGEITYFYEDGKKKAYYKGTFKDDNIEGRGELQCFDENGKKRSLYEGEFKKGAYDGQGKLARFYKDGKKQSLYEGEFKKSAYNGQGNLTYFYKNGKVLMIYRGGFKDSTFEGRGELQCFDENGKKKSLYEGEFREGYCHGQGELTYFYENGMPKELHKGTFKNNHLEKQDLEGRGELKEQDKLNYLNIDVLNELLRKNKEGTKDFLEGQGELQCFLNKDLLNKLLRKNNELTEDFLDAQKAINNHLERQNKLDYPNRDCLNKPLQKNKIYKVYP